MGILDHKLELVGSKGRTQRIALFDSGASYSIIRRDIAEAIAAPQPLSGGEVWEFETAMAGQIIRASSRVVLDFHFSDSEHRFSDEFIVFDSCSEEVVIGAKTMQAWKIKLDFEKEEVIYRKKAQRLRMMRHRRADGVLAR